MMAAELLDAAASDEQHDELPKEPQAMSTEDLVADLTPVSTTDQEDLQPVTSPTEDDEIPEKYRGKSIKEVIGMHQEAEKLVGRQGSEVGELRGIVDSFIKTQLEQTQQQPQPEPEPVDFFEDPQKAVSQAIDSHPTVQKAVSDAEQSRRAANMERIQAKHPDMQEVVQNPSFIEWVKASPIRTEIYQRADADFDYNAADELLTLYKERTQAVQQATQVETEARAQQIRAAQTGSNSGANTSGSKRVYRRADIIRLMKDDPSRYEALQSEILAAYAEGRVR